jgi:hypothetical protein
MTEAGDRGGGVGPRKKRTKGQNLHSNFLPFSDRLCYTLYYPYHSNNGLLCPNEEAHLGSPPAYTFNSR